MTLQEEFEKAAIDVMTLKERPGNGILLSLYSLHKQASVGDANGDEPGMFDIIAKVKYNAWASQKGMAKEEAMQQYVDLVNSLLAENN